jgi:hypothetical protein
VGIINTVTRCRLCQSSSLEVLWELSPAPYGDLFCEKKSDAKNLPKIDLTLQMCSACKFVQLGQVVDIDKIYKNYIYNSSNTQNLPSFYNRLSSSLISSLGLKLTDLIIDVGSNDGSALLPYLNKGFKVLGIEPSKIPSEKALSLGIPTIVSYLDDSSVSTCISQFGHAKLVMANYVSANVSNPVIFFKNLKDLITEDGTISIVTGYHPDQFSINMFEYINHDHLSYFSVSSAVNLANQVGLKLVSAERIEHKGGSIHLLFKHAENDSSVTESISQLLQRESWMQIENPAFYQLFKSRIERIIQKTQHELPLLGLIGIGASISTTHLLHQFQIGERFDVLLDEDRHKIATYSPGYGIPVKSFDYFSKNTPGIPVILAWQHSNILIRKVFQDKLANSVYIPLPNSVLVHNKV